MAVAADVMKTDIVTAEPSEDVGQVAQRMRDRDVGAVLVVADDALVGIFSERDLLVRVVAEGADSALTPVVEVATAKPITVQSDTHVRRCAEILREEGCRHLPVMDGTRPVGIISARDFFEHVTGELERIIDAHHYVDELGADRDPYDALGGGYRA